MSPLYLDGLASHSAASLDSTRVGRALVLLSSCLTPTKGEKLSVLGTGSYRHSLSQSSQLFSVRLWQGCSNARKCQVQ